MMSNQVMSPEWLERLVVLGRTAGDAIMAIYRARASWQVSHKDDDSPLTAADLAAHRLIMRELPGLLDVPVLSEEGVLPSFVERRTWGDYWLVDPLDGTKEFVAGNGEFTVNIALIRAGQPLLGLVHIPVTGVTYLGVLAASGLAGAGAWRYEAGQAPEPVKASSLMERYRQGLPLRVLTSHRHGAATTRPLLDRLQQQWPGGIVECHAGSSLKFCRIAEGDADFYPRLAPTSEWDTAAAQAVLEAAGGAVVFLPESANLLKPLRYNTRDSVINPDFYALGDAHFDWSGLLGVTSL
jgi:3'(2'), 5'-bisphosphate nucleotidase